MSAKPGPKPRTPTCHPRRKHEAKGFCEQCYRAWRRAHDPAYAARHRAQSRVAVAKIRATRPQCIAKQRKEYYARNAEFIRAQDRARPARPVHPSRRLARKLKRYGLTHEAFERLLVGQNGACAICERASVRLAVDHDHNTGRVRGLLCVGCNTALGNLRDGALFGAALRYLKGI